MSEWWTYTLSDFLLFSPRVYYRLFELHNNALWPAQLVTLVLGLAILVMLLRPVRARERIIPVLLGGLWLWIAWAFFWERYATINWASVYVAPVFVLEGLLLIGIGLARGGLALSRGGGFPNYAGIALFALTLAGYPLIAPAMGRPWSAAEVFGIAPDPTAVATLAVLALAQGRVRWALIVIPGLWCAVTGTTLWTMESGEFLAAPLGALAAVGIALLRRRPSQHDEQVHGAKH
jgi:hypothetical protein